jgi:HlyD family secretion protein
VARRLQIAILVLMALGVAAWWWSRRNATEVLAWQGYADADYVKVGPTQQGLLTAVAVARGDAVEAGGLLFTQDETADRASRDQAARQLAQAEEQLSNLQAGGKPTEIRQAEANLTDAQAMRDRMQEDLKRDEQLLPKGGISEQTLNQVRADSRSAEAKVAVAEAALAQVHAPMGREWEIKAQSAAVDAARAALDVAKWRLEQRRVVASVDARIADVLARPGETIAAGAPVVSLLPPGNILVRFFVPETALAHIHKGDAVALRCDHCPPDLAGTISFVSPQAEYTPPVIYSETSRAKLVYLVEARPRPDQATLINPGEPIEVAPKAPQIAETAPRSTP